MSHKLLTDGCFINALNVFALREKSFWGSFEPAGEATVCISSTISFQTRMANFPGDVELYFIESCNFNTDRRRSIGGPGAI